jgi:uncharacterized membrane protein YkvA (DUF1232 family)
MLQTLRRWARLLKGDVVMLWFAYRHPQTPLYAKILAVLVVAYAFSPIDLIPDFIPVLGYVDDLVLIPLGVWLVLRMIPPEIMAECRARATAEGVQVAERWLGASAIVALWLGVAYAAYRVWRGATAAPLDGR